MTRDLRLRADDGIVGEWFWDPGDPDDFLAQRQSFVLADAVGPGTRTYRLEVRASSGYVDVGQGAVTVLYIPTAYGSVGPPGLIRLPAEGGTGVQTALPAGSGPDVERERALSVAANQARIETEILRMQARRAELKVQLSRTRDLLEQER